MSGRKVQSDYDASWHERPGQRRIFGLWDSSMIRPGVIARSLERRRPYAAEMVHDFYESYPAIAAQPGLRGFRSTVVAAATGVCHCRGTDRNLYIRALSNFTPRSRTCRRCCMTKPCLRKNGSAFRLTLEYMQGILFAPAVVSSFCMRRLPIPLPTASPDTKNWSMYPSVWISANPTIFPSSSAMNGRFRIIRDAHASSAYSAGAHASSCA